MKFMIKCFEANYPECLGAVLVHKAPWIFQGLILCIVEQSPPDRLTQPLGIWKIIKGWLDPVVAGKVHFTNNMKEVEEFIPAKQIPNELDGEENWEYKYVEPVPGENDKMKDVETRDRLQAEREQQYKAFEEATIRWIQNPDGEAGKASKAQREAIATKLRTGYWTLDPYVRARSLYDRIGVIQAGGKIAPYPQTTAEKPKATVSGASVPPIVETSADDVD